MKTSKEDLVGILSAVELALGEDEAAIAREHEAVVDAVRAWADSRADVSCSREYPSEAGQPMPRARIGVRGFGARERDALMAKLLGGRPRIAVWPAGENGIYINPQTLLEGEVEQILRRLDEILGAPTRPSTETLEV
jgi:L-seryl-tRNA(Ser) seleniumtransferase